MTEPSSSLAPHSALLLLRGTRHDSRLLGKYPWLVQAHAGILGRWVCFECSLGLREQGKGQRVWPNSTAPLTLRILEEPSDPVQMGSSARHGISKVWVAFLKS